MVTLWKCVAEPSGNPPGPPHAARMPHTHTTHVGKTPLAGDKIDAPAAGAVPFRSYCGGVVKRTRNVSEYMLVLSLYLVQDSDRPPCWTLPEVVFLPPTLFIMTSCMSLPNVAF